MNTEKVKKKEKAGSNYLEIQPKGKVDQGNKAVKKPEDTVYRAKPAVVKDNNIVKKREESEQPVHPVKK